MIRRAAAILCAMAATALSPVQAQDIDPEAAAYQDMTLARVRPGERAYFYRDDVEGCPSVTNRCRKRAYLVAGDVVLIGASRGGLIKAAYTNGAGQPTEGWLSRALIQPIPSPPATPTAWPGYWTFDTANIRIATGTRPGRISADGTALWGTDDPDRVRQGGINDGEFTGEAIITGNRALFSDEDCRVSVRLIGPYLVAADNLRCGGLNVSFSGFYRR
ncbi:putative; ORF located using Glimmer/Genemark [hydrothermal vent metagenome]|jgi:hypothetical protein|uniref:Putative ORF located using Glimmer/Genemark n=1 Tax=hydrothermal vent metagenome TaxID=652676 RepID=A0A160TNE7_9ZZZZ